MKEKLKERLRISREQIKCEPKPKVYGRSYRYWLHTGLATAYEEVLRLMDEERYTEAG